MAAAPAVLHVAREGGGFASLTAARDAIRSLKAKGGVPPEGVLVVVQGGRTRWRTRGF
jgi:hypothetical protein